MKKNLLLLSLALAIGATLLMSNSGGRAAVGNSDNTGSPISSGTCANCHSGGSFEGAVTINVYEAGTTTPVTAYVPGTTYDLEIAFSDNGSADYGFQVACLDSGNEPVNGFANPSSGTRISTISNRDIFEQSQRISGNATAQWTAPAQGTGDVTFYAVGNFVNGNGGTSGDQVVTQTATLTEGFGVSTRQETRLPVSLTLFPNPVQDFLHLDIVGATSGTHQLMVVNTAGQIVENRQVELVFGMDRIDLNVAHLPVGQYQLVLAQGNQRIAQSFVKL